jgi:arylsulfatase A-like enzyme
MIHRIFVVLCSIVLTSGASAEPAKPNVLFIAVDDLNDWIGCLGGHPQALTPNMDRLAARGVLFTNAHCAAPACNPSRAAVFSGLMPEKTGIWSNQSGSIGKKMPDLTYLPQAFSKVGYRTLGTGKLLHRSASKLFDDYFSTEQRWSPLIKKAVQYTDAELPSKGSDSPKQIAKHNGREYTLPLNRMPSDRNPDKKDGESFDWGAWDVPDGEFGDTKITNWAIEQIEKAGDRPLFLGVGYYRPHIPLWAPARFFERFKERPAELPPFKPNDLDDVSDVAKKWAIEAVTAGSHATTVEHDQWRAAVEAYLACTTYVDYEIGRLLDALDRSELAENTVIVLWTDHGWHLGEKQHWGKWTGWERSTKVPLMIVPPKSQSTEFAEAGSRCGQPVGLIDLYPTLAELCAVDAPADLDGVSLVPLLETPTTKTGRKLVTTFDPGNVSARSERHRYIRYADGSEELYDLESDPNEWTNLAADEAHAELKAGFVE